MSSALAMWAYHRRLSMEAQNRINVQEEHDPNMHPAEKKRHRFKKRSQSESDASSPTERRVSFDPDHVPADLHDESHESKPHNGSDKEPEAGHSGKGHRRFSLDFLFKKKEKKSKDKNRQRSRSESEDHDHDHYDPGQHRYPPGIASPDFPVFLFI